jgi:hypothetical protein
MVLVIARALEFDGLAVEKKPFSASKRAVRMPKLTRSPSRTAPFELTVTTAV